MFKVALGHSEEPFSEDAAQEIIEQCRESLGDAVPAAGILFAGVDYDTNIVLEKIRKEFPGIQMVGCSSSGEISSAKGYSESSLLLITFASDTISMASVVARNISKDIEASVKEALAEAKAKLKGEPTLCLTFPDIFTVGTVKVVEEIQHQMGKAFPIFGGGASDPWKFDNTHEYYNEETLQDSAPMLFFAGPIEIVFSIGSGWVPFTTQKVIVDSDKNKIIKIGEDTALDFYMHYLGTPPSLAYPLAVYEGDESRYFLRVAIKTDEEDGSILFCGDLPKGARTSICQADPKDLIKETKRLMQETTNKLEKGRKPSCAFVVSCSGRQKILGTKTREEYRVLQESVSSEIPMFGFYAYGQVCPFALNERSLVHNESILTIYLQEQAVA